MTGRDISTSSDAGKTWNNQTTGTPASGQSWINVASDASGTHLVAINQSKAATSGGLEGGDIWTSSDAGRTWNNRTKGTSASGLEWQSVASDASGARLLAASAHGKVNDIFISTDAGLTWTDAIATTAAAGQEWNAVASDAVGAHLVAVSTNSAPPGGAMPCCLGDVWTN